MTDLRQQAEALYEREREELRRREVREQEANKEQGIRSHIQTIQEQRDEERREQARREASAEAEELAHELHKRGVKLQEFAEGLDSLIEGYADVRGRLVDAKRRAGQDVGGRDARSRLILEGWHRSVFGGHDSLLGVPHELAGTAGRAQDRGHRTLTERDPLSRPDTGPAAA